MFLPCPACIFPDLHRVTTPTIKKAFILGAGLGTRLRPLTESMPKPMVPLWNRPLITFAFDHCISDLGVDAFMVNTHHCPGAYTDAYPNHQYRDCSLDFRHESTLLDTAGGIDNIRDWLPKDGSFAVYNGDILTNLPLAPLVEAHERSGNLVTLCLRSGGHSRNVAWNKETGLVTDMRNLLESNSTDTFQFTGIYLMRPEFVEKFITPGKIESVVFPFVECIRQMQSIGGVVVDDGEWFDLGNRETLLEASDKAFAKWPGETRIHPDAKIDESARIDTTSVIGKNATIGPDTTIKNSILWDDARVAEGADLKNCIVRSNQTAEGNLRDVDL